MGQQIPYNIDCINASIVMLFTNCAHYLPADYRDLKLVYHGEIWTPSVIQRIVMLSVIMTLTLFGNLTIIVVLTCSRYRKLNSRVNIFIINLAIGDLTVCCFTMTTEILFVVFEGAWVLGAAACKILLYVQIVTLASTTFILTAMSFDRFMAICRPLSFGNTSSRARKMIMISWFLAFVFASPQLLIFKQKARGIYPDGEIKYKCQSKGYTAWWQRKLYFTFMASYILVIPAILISFCYINVVKVVWRQGQDLSSNGGVSLRRCMGDKKAIPRAKVKTIKMTLSIICSFIMCWTPYFVVHLIHIWSEYKYEIPEPVYVFAETMALLNSALNPILYGCFNIKLKRGLLEVFCPQKLSNERATSKMYGYSMPVSECVTLSPKEKHIANRTTRLAPKYFHEHSSGSSSCSHKEEGSDGSRSRKEPTRSRSKDNIIKEENRNGFRLRVRFTNGNKSPTHMSKLLGPYDKSDEEGDEVSAV